jgi:4-aminobutyrate aminotransferase
MIEIRTPLPGPRARALIERDAAVVSQSYVRDLDAPVVAARGQGMWIWDVDGNKLLDFAAGIAVCATGHCHPEVVRAIEEQARTLIHMSGTDFYYEPQVALAEKITTVVHGPFKKRVFFCNSGAEAIEAAFKLARYKTRRQHVIAYYGAFHGRTMGALSLTASKTVQRRRFAPLVPGVVHAPYPYTYRCPLGAAPDNCADACLDYLVNTIFKKEVDPYEVAAVFIEPIQGEGGYVPAPVDYLRELRRITREYGILLVVDEVQSGMGRTGKMFAYEWAGIDPDILCIAKGIASGMPLGLMVYRSDETDWEPGTHASTFGGNPVSCAAALTTIRLLEQGLMENARVMGDYMMQRLTALMDQHPSIGEVRGRGLMIGVEIVRDRKTRDKAPKKRGAIICAAYRRGLIMIGCGENTIRFSPPLIISQEEADEGLAVFDDALTAVERGDLKDVYPGIEGGA